MHFSPLSRRCSCCAWVARRRCRAGDKPPITIGFSMEQTGGLAAVGKTGLLAFQIWAENVNKKGGLLGRPVKLVYLRRPEQPAPTCPASTPS